MGDYAMFPKLQCSITNPITIHIMVISANRMTPDDPLEIRNIYKMWAQ